MQMQNIHYLQTGLPKHTLDLHLPSAPGRGRPLPPRPSLPPLLVYIHGGAWEDGDKEDYRVLGQRIADAGNFAVAVINYRLSLRSLQDGTQPLRHPAHIQDVAAALAFLALHGDNRPYRYRADRIYLCGHSAGAQISGLLVLDPRYLHDVQLSRSLIRAVIGVQGIYDIPGLLATWGDPYRGFIERAFGTDPAAYEAASPQYAVPSEEDGSLPAYLVIHSLEDELVDLPQAQKYHEHLLEIGLKQVELDVSLKGRHYEVLHTQEFAETVARFVWNIEGSSNV